MREIEFRCWNKIEKRMIPSVVPVSFPFPDQSIGEENYIQKNDYYVFMQYIGQKDKNKKKVFEGDIVKVPAGESGDNYYKECMAFVKYEDDGFVLENPNNRWKFVEQDWWWNEVEIVGNIFENPNLIAEYYDNKEFESIVYNKI